MEGMLAEVRLFGGNFAPRTWAFCDGQLLSIAQNTALFSLLGTIYGGDGRTTFALPDLRGRIPIGPGTGPGLSPFREGAKGGTETNTLNTIQIPSHNHSFQLPVNDEAAEDSSPEGNFLAVTAEDNYVETSADGHYGAGATVGNTGGGQSFNNMQPGLVLHYIICVQGIFPSRS
jgi:microcystin-dependent protein